VIADRDDARGRNLGPCAIKLTGNVRRLKTTVDAWVGAAELETGKLFRCVCRAGECWGDGVTERLVWHVVKQYAAELGFRAVAPHDLRRSCAKLCHAAGRRVGADPIPARARLGLDD